MSQDKMREDFEAEFVKRFGFGRLTASSNGDAGQMYIAAEWAWQASRAACVVELPSATCIRVHDYTPLEVRSYCAKAIVAAGLKCEVES